MSSDCLDLIFVPVTREQARLFSGVGRMLDRRGMECRFAVASVEIAETLLDEWGDLVSIVGVFQDERFVPETVP
ncbi:MAG: hypothetical protein ACE5EQ_03500, partial [Phycisphaerae bacterium]